MRREELGDLAPEARAARDGESEPPAQRRVNLREDKAVGQSALEVEPAQEGLSHLRELRGSPSDTHRPPDHPTLRR